MSDIDLVENQIINLESELSKYINLKDFNYKDYFTLFDYDSLFIDLRTKQIIDLYCLNLTNPFTINNEMPSIIVEAFTYINYLLKLNSFNLYG